MGRLIGRFLAVALLVGCSPSVSPPDACMPVVADAGTSACALPTYMPPAEVTNWEDFLTTASALVCRGSIVQGLHLSLTDSWCHPRFAALYVSRNTDGLPAFPAIEARACLEQLELSVDVINDGLACLELLDCAAPGACCPQRAAEGQVCGHHEDCAPWLACEDHVCRPRRACPEDPCPYEFDCLEGRCIPVSASCYVACPSGTRCEHRECVPVGSPAEVCREGEPCFGGTCGCGGICTGTRPLGCHCTSDDQCPDDVSVCNDGVCTARPMLGDPCDAALRCFASVCMEGLCARIPEGVDGCVGDAECAAGLVCGTSGTCGIFTSCQRRCITPTIEGGPCSPVGFCSGDLGCLSGVCRSSFGLGDPCEEIYGCGAAGNCIDGVCAEFPTVGEACDAALRCAPAMDCVAGTCLQRGELGAACGGTNAACAASGVCVAGVCRTRAEAGEPCDAPFVCASAICVEGTCRARTAIGEACVSDSCEFDAVCSGGVCMRLSSDGGPCVDGLCAWDASCVEGICYGRACR